PVERPRPPPPPPDPPPTRTRHRGPGPDRTTGIGAVQRPGLPGGRGDPRGPQRPPRRAAPLSADHQPHPRTAGGPGRTAAPSSPRPTAGLAPARGRLEAAGTGELRCGGRGGGQGWPPRRGAPRHLLAPRAGPRGGGWGG